MKYVFVLSVLCVLSACSANTPQPERFTADSLVWHLQGPDGFKKGPYASVEACEAERVSYVLPTGWDGGWSQWRCV